MLLQITTNEITLYHLLMVFTLKIVVFILGFFTIKMGHSLIRDGVKGSFKFNTEAKGIKGALQSSSPGLLFVLLGVLLIAYAIYIEKGVRSTEEGMHSNTTSSPKNNKDSTDWENLPIDVTRDTQNVE